MKMKAKAAKAARLFEKSKNSSAGKRSVSVASSLPVSDYESSIASRELLASAELPQDTNLPASADLSLTDGARILSNTKILASNHLEVSVVLEAATLNARALTTRNDILLENPALTGLPQENELRNTTKKYILDGEPSTKISPRLECQKRKRICKKKKNPVECETGTDTSCTNEKLPAKRAKDSTGKKACASKLKNPSKARKKAPGPRKIGNSLASIDESLERDKEIYESETGLNPGETTMRDLCLPERSRGISSEVLEQRTKLVVERREREKRERFATLQAKKMRNSRPLARSTDSRADEPAHASNNVSFQESRDEENVDSSAVSTETGTQAEPTAVEQTEEDKANHSDSEDNMEDLEEVIFEEFSSLKKRVSNAEASKTAKEPSKSSQQIHNEDEDEDFEEQEYVSEATQYAPQLRVVNGQLVLDQDSLEVNRQDPVSFRLLDVCFYLRF
ncbi:hypothetical protein BY996DRAFT_4393291 [Phakopsora pachyrhizi]|nr:hypothetical protein BY996DRAFT_4393291 [Phakopsora pachyrhizi]